MIKQKRFNFPIFFYLIGFAVLLFSVIGCEPENPGEPRPNVKPETYISEASAGVTTIISWYGTDRDGRVEKFEYRWDDGDWIETTEMSGTFTDIFADLEDTHTFYVRAIDNRNGTDPTPASVSLTPITVNPETEILEGPVFGDVVGSDVKFVWDGSDKDGKIAGFEYTLDNTKNWTAVDQHTKSKLYLGLPPGAHVFYVRAIDDLGAKDLTPAQSAFVVKSGFKPLLENTSPLSDGGGWFSGVDIRFSWKVDVSYYKGVLPDGAFTYALDDSTGYSDDRASMKIAWNSSSYWVASGDKVTDGSHTFYLKARDASGNVTKMKIGFTAGPFAPTEGVLLIDDFSWDSSTGVYRSDAHADSLVDQGFMNGHSHTDWDVPDQGTGVFTPDNLGKYSTVILFTDGGYASADFANLIAAYGVAGGNLLIAGYNNSSMGSAILTPFGFWHSFYGTFTGNYGGMDGNAGTAYENFNIDLPMKLDGTRMVERHYERVYPDAENTSTIFRVRGLDGDTRSCGVRADMPGGNVVIVIGQTVVFWDQESQDTRDFGEYVLVTEFGEQ
ncbi:MAG: hypothetical protein ACE5QV_04785 [Fidelibacterota bacterium]